MASIMDTVRSRMEAIRSGGAASGQGTGIVQTVRDRLESIREQQAGIVERIGGRFPALKRVRGQLEPWQRPALYERTVEKQKVEGRRVVTEAAGREFKLPEESSIF